MQHRSRSLAERPARTRIRDDRGVTLIEVIVASVLVAVLASVGLGIIIQTQSVEVGNRGRVAAASLAAREIDMVRQEFAASKTAPVALAAAGAVTNPHQLSGGVAGDPLVIDGTAYTVVRAAAWNFTVGGASACEGGALIAYPSLEVTVTVTWPDMGSVQPVVSATILSPEKGTGIPTGDSFIAVAVADSAGEPNSGRTVHVSAGATTYSGLTDPSGCAVVQVTPAVGGTTYVVTLDDPGYVDINGNQNPSKSTGAVTPGQLNSSVSFAYDLGGTVKVTLVDAGGAPLAAPGDLLATPAQVTLVASEYSGSSGNTLQTIDHGTTTLPGRWWPTQYGAYFGSTPPAGGYSSLDLAPGGTIDLQVTLALAALEVSGEPAGTDHLVAVPHAAGTTCTSPGAVAFSSNVSVLPGFWDVFAVGSGSSSFGCSPGPANVDLSSGGVIEVPWGSTTLQVTGAPTGTLFALHRDKAAAALTSCPSAAEQASAINADIARSGPAAWVAGDWYLYVKSGTGVCTSFPTTINASHIAYGMANPVMWPTSGPITLTVTGVPKAGSSDSYVLLSSTQTLTCNRNSVTTAGSTVTLGQGTSVTGSAPAGTWFVYSWDRRSSGATPRCVYGGKVVTGWSALTLPFSSASPVTVGP